LRIGAEKVLKRPADGVVADVLAVDRQGFYAPPGPGPGAAQRIGRAAFAVLQAAMLIQAVEFACP